MSELSANPSRLRAWLELARLSNAPTVLTNVLAGGVLGLASSPPTGSLTTTISKPGWSSLGLAMLAGLMLYTAGMVLNDAHDAERDRESRPKRPIPSGRIKRIHASVSGYSLLLAGVLAAYFANPNAAPVAITIGIGVTAYTLLHARHAWAVVFMAWCRFALYPLGALALATEPLRDTVLLPAMLLGLSTLLLTLVARAEATDSTIAKRPLAWSVGVVLLLAPLLIDPPQIRSAWGLVSALALAIWVARNARAAIAGRLQVAIPGWIAGFCLFDAMLLAMFDRPWLALAAAGAFVITHLAQRVLPGT